MNSNYPRFIQKSLYGGRAAIVVILCWGIFQSLFYHNWHLIVLYGLSLMIVALRNILLKRKVDNEGYEWRTFKVIAYTSLSRIQRRPSGVIALSCSGGDPIRRYHLPIISNMKIPLIGSTVDVCIPSHAKFGQVGRTTFISQYYDIVEDGRPL